MRRALVLKKETLTELTPRELHEVVGGYALTPNCPTHVDGCRVPTDHCQSANYACLISVNMDPCVSTP